MKRYYLLICLLATSVYAVAQPWTKNYDRSHRYDYATSFAEGVARVSQFDLNMPIFNQL